MWPLEWTTVFIIILSFLSSRRKPGFPVFITPPWLAGPYVKGCLSVTPNPFMVITPLYNPPANAVVLFPRHVFDDSHPEHFPHLNVRNRRGVTIAFRDPVKLVNLLSLPLRQSADGSLVSGEVYQVPKATTPYSLPNPRQRSAGRL